MQIHQKTVSAKKRKPAPQITEEATPKSKIQTETASKREKRGPQERVKAIVSAETRQRLIAETAYSYAEQRGFEGGDPLQDWLKAEAHIDSRYRIKR